MKRGEDKNILVKAIGNIDKAYVLEAMDYRTVKGRIYKKLILAAAVMLIVLCGTFIFSNIFLKESFQVYAKEAKKLIEDEEIALQTGIIYDDGSQRGIPVAFFIEGNNIKKIRFSCKNEFISFSIPEDEQEYGYSKNFTINYSEIEYTENCFLVWNPVNIIEKIQSRKISVEELSEDERRDVIVMEIYYENGYRETSALNIYVDTSGEIRARVSDYTITDKDDFVNGEDAAPLGTIIDSTQTQNVCESTADAFEKNEFSEEQKNVILQEAHDYYSKTVFCERKGDISVIEDEDNGLIVDYVNADKYEGWQFVCLNVEMLDENPDRTIVLGSSDGWKSCIVLNEGY